MDELMMYNYLKSRGIGNMNEHEFMDKFMAFMNKYRKEDMRHEGEDSFFPINDGHDDFYMRRHGKPDVPMGMFDSSKDKRFFDRFNAGRNAHFDESEAKYLVAGMYHTENGRKYTGEKFDMHKAKEVCERYRGILPTSVTSADVYVAINSQYHDYAELFKSWFGNDIEQKVVESAIVFWFKDIDAKSENKLMEYFREY